MKGSEVDKPDDDKQMSPFTIGNHRYMALSPSKVIAIQLYLPEMLNSLQSFHKKYQGPTSYATVIFLDQKTREVTEAWLRETLEAYRSTDDVFQDDFLSGVIFSRVKYPPSSSSLDISPSARRLLKSLGTMWLDTIESSLVDELPLPGPYIVVRRELREILRLHDDVQGAFIQSLMPLDQE